MTDEYPVSVDQALACLEEMMSTLYGGTRSDGRTVSSIEIYKPGEASGTTGTRSEGGHAGGGLPDNPGTIAGSAYYVIGFQEGGYSVMSATDPSASVVCITEAGSLTALEMMAIEVRLANMTPLPNDSLRWMSYEEIHNFGFGKGGNPEPFDITDYCDDPDAGDQSGEDSGEYIVPPARDDGFVKELVVDYLMKGQDGEINPETGLPWGFGEIMIPDEQGKIEDLPPGFKPGGGSTSYTYTYDYGDWTSLAAGKIGPLLSTKWDQNNPYNMLCPVKNGSTTLAGCTAIAVAQTIAWNERPSLSYFSPPGSPIVATWNQIKNVDYSQTTLTLPEQSIAIQMAMIIRNIGDGVNMSYGVSSSGATVAAAKRYMKNKLGYKNVEKKLGYKDSHIRDMLNRGLPAIIGANGSSGGHAWVIDGSVTQQRTVRTFRNGKLYKTTTESRSLIHCNFGWSGTADGYYFSGVFDTRNGPEAVAGGDPGTAGSYHFYKWYRTIKYTR